MRFRSSPTLLAFLATGVLALWVAFGVRPPVAEDVAPRLPSETGWLQRTYPHFAADPLAYRDAVAQKTALKRAGKGQDSGTWEFAGPGNIGGRITDLVVHPSRPQTLYAAAATGGVFKSEDLGQHWTPIFDDQPFLSMGDLAIAPSNPDVIYAGTGEANGGHNNYAGGGLYRSDDAGSNWTYRGLAETVSIGRVIVHPEDPDQIWVAGTGSYFEPNPERGVYKSSDGGATWDRTLFVNDSTGVVDLAMRPDNPDVLFATTWQRVRRVTGSFLHGRESAVYRSVDAGDSWEKLGPERGLPDPDDYLDSTGRSRIGRIGLAISESFPNAMYAYYTSGTGYLGLYKSGDGGDTWQDAHPDRSILQNVGSTDFGFSWYFGQIRVHPTDPDRVFIMDASVFRSSNGGASWDRKRGTHADHHAMVFHPSNPAAIFEGNDGGVSVSLNGGGTWDKLAPLPITQFYEIAFDPVRPERLFGGTQDNGTVWTSNGEQGDWQAVFGGDGFYVLPIPSDGTTVYAESQGGNMVRVDGLFDGNPFPLPLTAGTGIPAGERRNWATPLAMDPFDSRTLYYGTHRIWRTEDAVETPWQAISPDLTNGTDIAKLGTVTNISISPLDGSVIWAGTDDGNVWVSWDYGTNWNDVTGELPKRWVTRVLPAPDDVATSFVTFSGLKWRDSESHVYRTRDLGATWQDISSGLPEAPVNAIAVDPRHSDHIFVGTDIGMFASMDDGLSWFPMDNGMPAVTIADLKADGPGRRLIAGTHGRGMYTFDMDELSGTTGNEPDPVLPTSLAVEPAYPNPFQASTRIQVEGSVRGAAVYDMLGRLVASATVLTLGGEKAIVEWDGKILGGASASAGHYVIVITGTSGVRSVPVVRVP
ncbi:MAG: hypothetical protein ACI80V_002445 [Rhodothermales bacterium]|jgi:hypothetical protein